MHTEHSLHSMTMKPTLSVGACRLVAGSLGTHQSTVVHSACCRGGCRGYILDVAWPASVKFDSGRCCTERTHRPAAHLTSETARRSDHQHQQLPAIRAIAAQHSKSTYTKHQPAHRPTRISASVIVFALQTVKLPMTYGWIDLQ